MSELPKGVKEKLDEWFKGEDNYGILHFWESFHKDTYYIVCGYFGVFWHIYFIRVFKMGDEWSLSQDKDEEIR
jgi:hypothetical protein